jgi:hypothetical protein
MKVATARCMPLFGPSILLASLMLPAVAANAQTVTGAVQGRVLDPAGSAIPGAGVHAKEASTGAVRMTRTNSEGFYEFSYLALGEYELTAEAARFQAETGKASVELNLTTVLNFELALAGTKETVMVSEAVPSIDVVSGQIRRSMDAGEIAAIPLQRSIINLAPLLSGFQTNPTPGQNSPTLSSGSSVSFDGTGTRATTFQTDGIANDDSSENQNRQDVNISTIRAFQILTNSFSAEFGRGAGAVVLVETKSGTNQYHGEAFWETQNSALNANGFFQNEAGSEIDPSTGKLVPVSPKAVSKSHRIGGVFGGPAIKSKLFYIGSYERAWSPGTVSEMVSLLPPQYRTADVDPQLPDAGARVAFINSIVARYPDLQPNDTVNNPYGYIANVGQKNPIADISARVDYQLGPNDTFYTRYQYGTFFQATDDIVKGVNTEQNNRFQNYGLAWTHVYSPRITGEGRFGFGRRRMIVSFVDGDNVPIITWTIANAPTTIGSPGQYPLKRYQNDFQFVYNVSAQLGSRHTLRFGADVRRSQLNDELQNYNRGNWGFSSAGSNNAYQNFDQGVVQTYQQGFGPEENGFRSTEVNLYVQDAWRVSNSLTLNLGARFEYVGKPTEVNNLVNLGYPSDSYVEPRFGFAYAPVSKGGFLGKLIGGQGKSVLRGGFGMFHGRIFQSIFSQVSAAVRYDPPNGATVTASNPNMSVADPLGTYQFTPGPPTTQVILTLADPNLHMPYTEQWNMTFERQLPFHSTLSLSYVGNRGIGFLQYNGNNRAQFPIVSTVPSTYPGNNFTGVLINQIDPNLFDANPPPGEISLAQPYTNQRRPDGQYSIILQVSNNEWTYYNAMQAVYTKTLSRGLTIHGAYTWSKNIDTGSEATFVGTGDTNFAISTNQTARSLRGLSRLDQPQRLVIVSTYDLPFYKTETGVLGRVLGGWQVNGISTFAAGNPVTVVLGYDLNGDGIAGDRPWLTDLAVFGKSFDNARINPATGVQYSMGTIPASAFYPNQAVANAHDWPWYPGTNYVASSGRNIFRIQGQNNFDVAFVKNTKLFGREHTHELQFRAEMFNLFNRVQFGLPNLTLVDTGVPDYRINPNFGQITSQRNTPRTMQLMLRYQF